MRVSSIQSHIHQCWGKKSYGWFSELHQPQRKSIKSCQNYLQSHKSQTSSSCLQKPTINIRNQRLSWNEIKRYSKRSHCFAKQSSRCSTNLCIDLGRTWKRIYFVIQLYLSSEHRLWVWSSETGKEIVSYDIEQEGPDDLVRSLVLTQKHIIVFYSNGRAEWLIKYYPELLD